MNEAYHFECDAAALALLADEEATENAESAKQEAEEAAKERAAMQEQLRNISLQLKLKREADEAKKRTEVPTR